MLYNVLMNKVLSLFISFVTAGNLVLVPVMVRAETESESSHASTTEVTKETETNEQKKTRASRVEEYKKNVKDKLSQTSKAKIVDKCEKAQSVAKTRHSKDENNLKGRSTAYSKIVEALERTSVRLKNDGIDVSKLESNTTELNAKIQNFNALEATSRQTLQDLSLIDCKSDPEAFKAALESARTARQNTQVAAKEVRTYLKDVVKQTLKTLKVERENQVTNQED